MEIGCGLVVGDSVDHIGDLLFFFGRKHIGNRIVLFFLELLEFAHERLDLILVIRNIADQLLHIFFEL